MEKLLLKIAIYNFIVNYHDHDKFIRICDRVTSKIEQRYSKFFRREPTRSKTGDNTKTFVINKKESLSKLMFQYIDTIVNTIGDDNIDLIKYHNFIEYINNCFEINDISIFQKYKTIGSKYYFPVNNDKNLDSSINKLNKELQLCIAFSRI